MAHNKIKKFSKMTLFGRRYFWHFRRNNGRIMFDGGEGYNTRAARDESLEEALDLIQSGQYVIEDER